MDDQRWLDRLQAYAGGLANRQVSGQYGTAPGQSSGSSFEDELSRPIPVDSSPIRFSGLPPAKPVVSSGEVDYSRPQSAITEAAMTDPRAIQSGSVQYTMPEPVGPPAPPPGQGTPIGLRYDVGDGRGMREYTREEANQANVSQPGGSDAEAYQRYHANLYDQSPADVARENYMKSYFEQGGPLAEARIKAGSQRGPAAASQSAGLSQWVQDNVASDMAELQKRGIQPTPEHAQKAWDRYAKLAMFQAQLASMFQGGREPVGGVSDYLPQSE